MTEYTMESPIVTSTTVFENTYAPQLSLTHQNAAGLVEISVVVDGCGIHEIINQQDECHIGDMYIVGSGIPHSYFAKSTVEKPTVCSISFDSSTLFHGEWADPTSAQYCYGVFRDHVPISFAALNTHALTEFCSIFDDIQNEIRAKDTNWQQACCSKLIMLLINISRYINMADTAPCNRSKDWITVSTAMRYVMSHCEDSNLSLESLASTLHTSPSSLYRLFPKVTGDTFAEYVRKARISRACKLLRTSKLTNEQIVIQCGLRDLPTFYKLFKAQIGMTPYQYRISQRVYFGEHIPGICMEISEQLQLGKWNVVRELVQQAIAEGLSADQILNEGLLAGMSLVGERFKKSEVYVPEVLVAARAMNAGMQELKPLLIGAGVQSNGKVCIGTVQGDLHDIGKNLVKLMMEGKGLEVIDLGTDVAPEVFVRTAIEQGCKVICCSALLTTTMDVIADVVKCAEEAGIRNKVKIMIGGAPVTESFCQEIGADLYTSDAASAADAAAALCGAL